MPYFSFLEGCLTSTKLPTNYFYWQTGAEANARGLKITPNIIFRSWRNISDNIGSITRTTQRLTLFTMCAVFATASATMVMGPSVTGITPEFSPIYFIRASVAYSFSARHLGTE